MNTHTIKFEACRKYGVSTDIGTSCRSGSCCGK